MRKTILVALLALFSCTTALAQFKAGIEGTVTDQKGGAVGSVKVTVTNQETGVRRDTITSPEGFYRISGLPPGKYSVTVEMTGFKTSVSKDVEVAAETVRGFNVQLTIGAVTEQVTVTATAEGIQTENANTTATLSTQEILRLPQVGRDPYELVRFAPGIFGDLARTGAGQSVGFPNGPGSGTQPTGGPGGSNSSIFQTENQLPISANGQRISANNYTIDGVSVNSQTWGGAAVVTPNQESVKEVTVLSSSYSAEDGRNTGAQIKVVSQNGTNDFHGSAFLKYDEPGLNAFNKFPGSAKRVENKLRQFGGSIGGPVMKDKLFFFFSYEGLRVNNLEQLDKYVETSQYRDLIKAQRAGSVTATILSQPGIEPRIVSLLTATCADFGGRPCAPAGTGLDLGSPTGATGQYVLLSNPGGGGLDGVPDVVFAVIGVPHETHGHQFNARVDYARGPNQFAVSTYFTRRSDLNGDASAQGRPIADISSRPFNPAATVSWIRTLSSTMLNEARFNFTRFAFDETATNSSANLGIPRVEVEGYLPAGDRLRFGFPRSETTPGVFAENTYSFKDVFSTVHGPHGLKTGVDITWEQDNNNLLGGARPGYSLVGPWNLANGTPITESINTDPRSGAGANAQRYFRTQTLGIFVQDDWKYRPNLTLNIGLRYEYFTPLKDTSGQLTNLLLGSGSDPLFNARVSPVNRLFAPDRNNFAPRLGFAWSPGHFHNKLAVRGGFGVAFNRIHEALFANTRGNVPFFARWSLCCGTGPTDPQFGDFPGPFASGMITYVTGSSNSILSYPVNPALTKGLNSTTNLPISGAVEIWGTPSQMPNAYVYASSLETEYELPWHMLTTLGYQGSVSHRLIRIVNQNLIFDKLNPSISAAFVITPDVNANFHSLNWRLQRQFHRGLAFSLAYRWSKSIDTLSNEGPGFGTNQTDPRNPKSERGPSDYDATHSWVFTSLWDLPILRGRSDWVGRAFGGWQINSVFTFHSGFPWTPVTFVNCLPLPSGQNVCPARPFQYLGGAQTNADTGTFLKQFGNFPGLQLFGPTVDCGKTTKPGQPYFTICSSGPPGVGRNAFRGPRFSVWDFSIVKETRLPNMPIFGENSKIDFRANFFNAFNKLNLAPFGFSTGSTVVPDPNFGRSTLGLAGRVIEFQARFSF
jgi:hypothetical protein